MTNFLEALFKLSENKTTIRKEMMAGVATFMTMAYVLATIPNIMNGTGFSRESILTSMILLIIITTVSMAIYTNRPFALAPGLGSVSIVAGMIVNENIPNEIAGGVIVLSGILFMIVSFLGMREAVIKVIPKSLKFAVSAGVGLFIALIGAKGAGLIIANAARKSLQFGDLSSPKVLMCLIGFILIIIFKLRKIPGDMILAILITTLIGIPLGITKVPTSFLAQPHGVFENFLKIDIVSALNFSYIPFLIALFIPDFFSTFGTVLGVGAKAGYLDENGDLPGIDKCFKIDAMATTLGGLFVIPCMTTYLESSVGVEEGGRTGLTVISTSICFFLALFFAPIALMIPGAATAPALIYIGISMLNGMKNIDYSDPTESFPSFVCVTFTIFANNIANGICLALPLYALMKVISGKHKELSKTMYIVVGVCFIYFYSLITK